MIEVERTPLKRRSKPEMVTPTGRRIVAICIFGLAFVTIARASDTLAARAFLEKIYAGYVDDALPPPVLGISAPTIFSPALVALIREDQQRARGEAGRLDYDPICGCQDFNQLKVTAIHLKVLGPHRLRATVGIVNAGQAKSFDFALVLEHDEWRIADVREPGVPSLVRFLSAGRAKPRSEPPISTTTTH